MNVTIEDTQNSLDWANDQLRQAKLSTARQNERGFDEHIALAQTGALLSIADMLVKIAVALEYANEEAGIDRHRQGMIDLYRNGLED